MTTQRYELAFLDELARDASRSLTPSETHLLNLAREALEAADAVVIHFGGKSGRLGEAIVGTAFLEGTLQTLAALGKQHTPLTVIIDRSIAELVSVSEYRTRYWPEIAVIVALPSEVDAMGLASFVGPSARNILALDFHAEHDVAPYLVIEKIEE
ncbi:MAG TPA: hypothetical protein VH591_09000 [Ktedonobacterales bacterium]|jgi:hypothetical protein